MNLFKMLSSSSPEIKLPCTTERLTTVFQSETETNEDFKQRGSKERRPATRSRLALWWLEILAATLSLGCLLILIVVLSAIDSKPYETFRVRNFDITPNTFVSIIATFGKASFLFALARSLSQIKWRHFQTGPHRLVELQTIDDASRGPLGSLKLLCTLRFRNLLASFGAILIVLAIASDPFTQQILSYPVLMDNAINQTAFIGASHAFNSGGRNLMDQGTNSDAREITKAMSGAVFGSSVEAKFDCPSGKCTWPAFESLGICTDCQDVSDQLEISCQNNGTLCTYLPPGESRQARFPTWALWVYTSILAPVGECWVPTTKVNVSVLPAQWPLKVEEDGLLDTITAFRFPQHIESAPQNFVPEAVQCRVRFCVKTYAASRVDAGILKESAPSSTKVLVDKRACHVFEGYPWLCPISRTMTGLSSTHHSEDEIFWLNLFDISLMQSNVFSLFNNLKVLSAELIWNRTGGHYPSLNESELSQLPKGYSKELVTSNSFGEMSPGTVIYELTLQWPSNLSQVFDNAGTSLTNHLRNSANSAQVQGDVLISVVHIHVKWPWLIYFASLSVFAVLLLGLCIFISKGEDEPIWKSSILPLISYGLLSQREDTLNTVQEGMEERFKYIRVQLSKGDTGPLIFREV